VNPGSTSIGRRHSKFCLFTYDEAPWIAGDGTGASISRQIGFSLAQIAFSEAQRRAEKATS